jgi:hypothetical protein
MKTITWSWTYIPAAIVILIINVLLSTFTVVTVWNWLVAPLPPEAFNWAAAVILIGATILDTYKRAEIVNVPFRVIVMWNAARWVTFCGILLCAFLIKFVAGG